MSAGNWTVSSGSLADGTPFTILQLIDDKSRFPIATHAAAGERAEDAIAVVRAGIERFQVPCRLLTDNGVAFNRDRLGKKTQLVAWLETLGCRPVTGSPGHPQSQGKDERAHWTLQKWLQAHDAPSDLTQAQQLVDQFDAGFVDRRHQSLRMRTPAQALAAGPVAIPPLPPTPAQQPQRSTARQAQVSDTGSIRTGNIRINLSYSRRGQTVTIISAGAVVNVFDQHGEHIRTVHLEPGRRYYGNGQPRGPRPTKCPD
jgi:putative transposase